jgi:prenyltransferase beta subunit
MNPGICRRDLLRSVAVAAVSFNACRAWAADDGGGEDAIAAGALEFIRRCARDDGGYSPSPDPKYKGNSDTGLSDLAAVTYAATLAKTMGWKLPNPDKSIEFIHRHQHPDGSFVNLGGRMDPKQDGAVLYNTTQGVVALRALGQRPEIDPAPVMDRFFAGESYKKLPWYTTSFFPLFYAALEKPYPKEYDQKLRDRQIANQAEDGYLAGHVASTFHMAHYFRLIRQPTPRARQMVQTVLKNQKPDGGFDIKKPDWDVHACFDAVFILRQLGEDAQDVRKAIAKAAEWSLRCRNADGGFGHFPNWPSDMDAVYFQFGTLIQAGRIAGAARDIPDAHTLSWGHAMQPGKVY